MREIHVDKNGEATLDGTVLNAEPRGGPVLFRLSLDVDTQYEVKGDISGILSQIEQKMAESNNFGDANAFSMSDQLNKRKEDRVVYRSAQLYHI